MITLDSVIEDLQAELGSNTQHDYEHLLTLMVRGLEDLHYDVNGYMKRKEIEPDSMGTVQLPDDFVKEVKIGVVTAGGGLVFLGRNQNIFKELDNCGNISSPQQNNLAYGIGTASSSSVNHYQNGEIIGAYYGVGGRSTAGEFRMNRAENRIELSSNLTSSVVVLDYIARPEQVNGKFHVHEFLREPLMRYAMWKSQRWFVGTQAAHQLEKSYVNAKNWARVRFGGMSQTELLDIIRRNFSQTPKF